TAGVKALHVRAHAVAAVHLCNEPFERNRRPDGGAVTMHGDGHGLDDSAGAAQSLRRLAHLGIDIRLAGRPAEPFLNEPDAHAGHAAADAGRVAVFLDLNIVLPWIEP